MSVATSIGPTTQPPLNDHAGERKPPRRGGTPKDWAVRSPDGTEYRFRNLALFLREHASLFRPDDLVPLSKSTSGPSRAVLGLSRLRPDHRRAVRQWRGWTWADPVPPRPVPRRAGGTWALRSPDGAEHRFQNLSAFVLENPGLFEPADLVPYGKRLQCRAMVCLRQLRPRPGNRHKSWNGWEWIG